MSQSKYAGRGGDDAERDRPPQPESQFPVERLGQPMEGGATDFSSRVDAVVLGLVNRDIRLPEYAARFGIPLQGVDAPKDVPMRLSRLYAGVRAHEDKDNAYYTVCVGLGRYPGDPNPDYVMTRDADRNDTSGGISKVMNGIFSFWENHDGPEQGFYSAPIAEGQYHISAWAKYHLAVPKDGGKPYLIINPLQYSSLTEGGQNAFKRELEGIASEGPTSDERRKAAWRLKHLSSPYQYSDRDVALGIIGLAVAEQLGVDVVCTPYSENNITRKSKVNGVLRQTNQGIEVVDGMRPQQT